MMITPSKGIIIHYDMWHQQVIKHEVLEDLSLFEFEDMKERESNERSTSDWEDTDPVLKKRR